MSKSSNFELLNDSKVISKRIKDISIYIRQVINIYIFFKKIKENRFMTLYLSISL